MLVDRSPLLVLLLALFSPTSAMAAMGAPAAPYLVQDLHTGTSNDSGELGYTLFHDGVLYFTSSDSTYGRELWRSDGTPEGTYRITDACPGRCGSDPRDLAVAGGRVYFSASNGVSGRELWQSDGHPGTERQVRDFCLGPCSSYPSGRALGGKLLFVAVDGPSRWLWRTDGTALGTVRIKKLCARACYPSELQQIGGLLLFAMESIGGSTELWRSDGTPGGTLAFRKLPSPYRAEIVPADGFAFVWTTEALWRTNGTAGGTVRLKTANELVGDAAVYAEGSVVWKGGLYSILDDGGLMRSDGTAAGTIILASFEDSFALRSLTPLADQLLFLAGESDYLYDVWRTRGTPETTERAVGTIPVEGDGLSSLVRIGTNRALLPVSVATNSHFDLWITDGTEEGSRRLQDVVLPGTPVPAGDLAYFNPGDRLNFSGSILRTDGTEAGTFLVRDNAREPGSGGPLASAVLGGQLVFSARTAQESAPLFASDGTPAGTRLLSARAQWAEDFTQVKDRLFFATGMRIPTWFYRTQVGLWTTDASPAGTVLASGTAHWIRNPSVFKNQLLFAADRNGRPPSFDDNSTERELFRSDGAKSGTQLVKNINPFSTENGGSLYLSCDNDPSNPGPGLTVGGRLLFAADDGRVGRELWSSDGTTAGTRLVYDIDARFTPAPAPNRCAHPSQVGLSSDPRELTALRGGAVFAATDKKTGRELWWTDGTAAGTRRVADLRPGPNDSLPHDLTPFGGLVYFFATASGQGEGLWRTDGTARGTVLVRDLSLNGLPSWGASLRAAGDRLFFAVDNPATGAELWTSRGTQVSTTLVADLRPGPLGSFPQALADAGGFLVFAADNGLSGLEPWRSDGTAAGTAPLGDINPGRAPSSPGPFSRVENLLLAGADDGAHGRELWAVPLDATPSDPRR
jgi:ELWxxDGT repeat protein